MEAKIIRGDITAEFDTEERCHIIEYSNSEQDPELSIARARVSPGVTTRWHRLQGTAERYHILSGEGLVEVGTLTETPVGPGDTVLIPPGCRQRITNTGQVDLIFLAICSPRFRPEDYEDAEGDSAGRAADFYQPRRMSWRPET